MICPNIQKKSMDYKKELKRFIMHMRKETEWTFRHI